MKTFPVSCPALERWLFLATLTLLFVFLADTAFAACPAPTSPSGVQCTDQPNFDICLPAAGTGIISEIVKNITQIVNGIAGKMFNSLLVNSNFLNAIRTVLMLYIGIYGLLFIYGGSRITVVDFVIRLLKLAIVVGLITPGLWIDPAGYAGGTPQTNYVAMSPWTFFSKYVVDFFNKGTDEVIFKMSQIAVGQGWVGTDNKATFVIFDNAVKFMTSPKLVATLFACLFSGPYGLIFGFLIFMGLGQFVGAIFQAMWIYLMGLTVRAFLFSLAPIFFCFLLFQRTRNLFDGWLNQVVSSCLQPIFLFTFFAYFANLIYGAMQALVKTPVCQVPLPKGCFGGTPDTCTLWRFKTGNTIPKATLDFTDPFPISIIDVLVFILLVQLAGKFNHIVVAIAKEIAGAATNLDLSGKAAGALGSGEGASAALSKTAGQAGKKVLEQARKAVIRNPTRGI